MSRERILFPLPGAPRPFPVRVAVGEDESLQSYVDRLSARHNVSLGQTLSRLGMISKVRQHPLTGYGITMTDQQRRNFGFVAGLDDAQIQSMLLSRFSGVATDFSGMTPEDPRTIRKVATSEWAYFSGSHFCPECLRESGGVWKLSWKLPWSFACTKHNALLHDHCPDCGGRPSSGLRDGSLSPAFIGKTPKPGFCGNTLAAGKALLGQGSTPCGCNLMNVMNHHLDDSDPIIATQKKIDEFLTAPDLADHGESMEFFREMRSICALVLYRAEIEDFPDLPEPMQQAVIDHVNRRNMAQESRTESANEGGSAINGARPRFYIGAPKSAALMAAVVQLALPIVENVDPAELRKSLSLLADRIINRSSKYRYAVLDYFSLSDRLRDALSDGIAKKGTFNRRAGHLSIAAINSEKLAKRSAGDVNGETINAGLQYEPKHIPQLIPERIFEEKFKRFFPNVQDRFARRFCSLAAVKRLGHTWLESAHLLDLPKTMNGMANRCVMLLNQQGDYESFIGELQHWVEMIAMSKNRIDYAERRLLLNDFEDFPKPKWLEICAAAGINPGNNGSRSKYAATWLWSEVTCGDWVLAPALLTHTNGNHQRDVYKATVKALMPSLAPILVKEGQLMLDALIGSSREKADEKAIELTSHLVDHNHPSALTGHHDTHRRNDN
jgi:hypothetical protein